jgi:hypothetical protein
VCDLSGKVVAFGREISRSTARYKAARALFQLLLATSCGLDLRENEAQTTLLATATKSLGLNDQSPPSPGASAASRHVIRFVTRNDLARKPLAPAIGACAWAHSSGNVVMKMKGVAPHAHVQQQVKTIHRRHLQVRDYARRVVQLWRFQELLSRPERMYDVTARR